MLIKPLTHEAFKRVVDDFCKRNGMSRRTIGLLALNDAPFFLRLQKGISPTLRKVERIYDFMIEYERKAQEEAENVSSKPRRD